MGPNAMPTPPLCPVHRRPMRWTMWHGEYQWVCEPVLTTTRLRSRVRDGEPQWQLRCPGCGEWADIDDDQLHGRVSVEHSAGSDDRGYASSTGCGYHETRDWYSEEVRHGF